MRQSDLAAAAAVAQSTVSAIERGRFASTSLATLRRVADVLDVALPLAPRWRSGDLARLLDAAHAELVERVVRELRALGWAVVPEYTYNRFGERGSVDVLAWHPERRALLIVEVESRLVDVQDLLMRLGAKSRIVPDVVARERGWHAASVARVLVAPGSHHVRSVLAAHGATFRASFPARSWDVKRWLREPTGLLAGVWLLPVIAPGAGTREGA